MAFSSRERNKKSKPSSYQYVAYINSLKESYPVKNLLIHVYVNVYVCKCFIKLVPLLQINMKL